MSFSLTIPALGSSARRRLGRVFCGPMRRCVQTGAGAVSYTHLDVYKRQGSGRPAPASIAFVPPVAGLLIAGEVIRELSGTD